MSLDYWTEQQRLADDYQAAEGARQHDEWQIKVKGYFEWRDRLSYDEDNGYIRFVEEDQERREQFGITEADEKEWRQSKLQAADASLPF